MKRRTAARLLRLDAAKAWSPAEVEAAYRAALERMQAPRGSAGGGFWASLPPDRRRALLRRARQTALAMPWPRAAPRRAWRPPAPARCLVWGSWLAGALLLVGAWLITHRLGWGG